jgi:hypothetical protein
VIASVQASSLRRGNPARQERGKAMAFTETDFTVGNHGSIFILQPMNDAARSWIDVNLYEGDDGPQWWGGGVVVEHRFIGDIVEGAIAEGLSVS